MTTIPTEIQLFLEKLLKEANMQPPSKDLYDKMIWDLYGRLENHLLVSYMQALPNEKAQAFDAFMKTDPNQEAFAAFISEHIPDYQEVAARAMLEFRDVYIGATAK